MPIDDPIPQALRDDLLKRAFLPLAIRNTNQSLDTARKLLTDGFPSPAFVWAVRSAEIFLREALLFPIWFAETGDVEHSFREVRRSFGDGGRWNLSIRRVREAYGLEGDDHDALTDSGEDAFAAWTRDFVGPRGEIVHGRTEADDYMAETAIAFTDRMREWFTIRVVASDRGPFAGTLREIFEQARSLYEAERDRVDPEQPGSDA